MAENKEVATRPADALQPAQSARPEAVLRPAADIFEDDEGITLQLDVPGASKERLTLQVNRDRLDVDAEVRIEMPTGIEALYADVRSTHYQRTFALSSELETDKIDASLKDGVLTLRIPKRAEVRPRRVEVRTS